MLTNNFYSAIAVYTGLLATAAPVTTYSGYERDMNTSATASPILKTIAKTVKFVSSITSSTASSNSAVTGVVFGDGIAPASPTDYKMAGDLMSSGSVSVAQTNNIADDRSYMELTNVYTITNTMDKDFTISEVGIVSGFGNNSINYHTILLERTLLDEPITIPVGGVGVVTHTIRINYNTA